MRSFVPKLLLWAASASVGGCLFLVPPLPNANEDCGNGVEDDGEECDDGNNIDADGCEADCTLPACDNGIVDPAELCLDENDTIGVLLPNVLALGDINNDGLDDVATISNITVTAFASQGDGSFVEAFSSTPGGGLAGVAVSDLDGDNLAELVVSTSQNDVKVFENLGNGSFSETALIFAIDNNPAQVLLVDLNGDGDRDILVATQGDNSISVLLNQGNLSFAANAPVDMNGNVSTLAVGDLDENGDLDLVGGDEVQNNVRVALNQNGVFGAPLAFNVGSEQLSVSVGDLDGDNNLDIAAALNGQATVAVLLGDGAGGFAVDPLLVAVPDNPRTSLIADFDLNGSLDILSAGGNQVALVLNDGGNFDDQNPTLFAGQTQVGALAFGDINGDGAQDFVNNIPGLNVVTVVFSAP